MDGQKTLEQSRALEETKGSGPSHEAKIIVTTALADLKNAGTAYHILCDVHLMKPIQKAKLLEELRKLNLIE